MSLRDIIFGRPLASSEGAKEELGVITGVPALGLDALASTAYGPEAALIALMPLGAAGLHYYPAIIFAIVGLLAALYASYRQIAAAYPRGGGAYTVAKDNLGSKVGVWAAVALLLDYLLNVAVGISAGVGAVISAIPALHSHILGLSLAVLLTLTVLNLRGVRSSGLILTLPVAAFVVCLATIIGLGIARALQSGGHPEAIATPAAIPPAAGTASAWLFLAAFANGCTAMTGIEAVSNGVPLFRKPSVKNAQRTLTAIVAILSLFLLGLAYLCPAFEIGAMDERVSGYQTVLAQLVAAVAGRGVFYHLSLAAIFIVLTYSAQTSFADFPRVCRLLAEDEYLPHAFAIRGRRLVFSYGIIVLAVLSALLLIAFGGVTEGLIPLFAAGAFSAFLLSQTGMIIHWAKKRGRGWWLKLLCNTLGAAVTGAALIVIVTAKFVHGAWMVAVAGPAIVLLLNKIKRHYRVIGRQVDYPLKLAAGKSARPLVIIPIEGWNRVSEKAVRLGTLFSDDIVALHISTEKDDKQLLQKLWAEKVEEPARAAGLVPPRLEIIDSPYRRIYQPVLDFINEAKQAKPDRLVAIIVPELVEPHWYEYLLHNLHGKVLRSLIYLKGDDRTAVINSPWYLKDI